MKTGIFQSEKQIQSAQTAKIKQLETENQQLREILYKWADYSDMDDSNAAINLRCETDKLLNSGIAG